jgi:hypothetical protein
MLGGLGVGVITVSHPLELRNMRSKVEQFLSSVLVYAIETVPEL